MSVYFEIGSVKKSYFHWILRDKYILYVLFEVQATPNTIVVTKYMHIDVVY